MLGWTKISKLNRILLLNKTWNQNAKFSCSARLPLVQMIINHLNIGRVREVESSVVSRLTDTAPPDILSSTSSPLVKKDRFKTCLFFMLVNYQQIWEKFPRHFEKLIYLIIFMFPREKIIKLLKNFLHESFANFSQFTVTLVLNE